MQAGITSGNRHYFQKDYDAVDGKLKKHFFDWAWRADRLTAMIVIRSSNETIEKVDFRISDFVSQEGAILSKKHCSLKAIKEVDAYLGRGFKHGEIPQGPKAKVGDVIHQAGPMKIEAQRLQSYWLSLDIPEDLKVGLYTGKIELVIDDLVSDVLSYSFEVLDLLQPELNHDDFSMELWQYPYTVARYYQIPKEELFEKEHLSILKEHLKAYKELGGHSITTTIVEDPWNHQTTDPYPSMVRWTKKKDGSFAYDFTDFDRYVDLAISLGINRQIKSFSMLPWENRIIYYDERQGRLIERKEEAGSKAWKAIWSSFLEAFVQHLDQRDLFDITYIALDEWPLHVLKDVLDLVKAHPNKDGRCLKVHAAMDYNDLHHPLLREIDDISLNLAQIKHDSDELRDLVAERRKLALTTTIYTAVENYPNSFAFSDPAESAWTLWYALSHQVDGFLRWALDAWVEDPLQDISHWYWESGDPFFIYPKELDVKDRKPYRSPRFEKLKEARRDLAKMQYLAQESTVYQEKVNKILNSIDRVDGKKNEYGAMTAGSEENKVLIDQTMQRLRKDLYDLSKHLVQEKESRLKKWS